MKIILTGTAVLLLSSAVTTEYSRLNEELRDASVEYAKSVMAEEKEERSFAAEESTVVKTIELPYKAKGTQNLCQAEFDLSYTQAVSKAKVSADINLVESAAECPKAHGQYRVRVRSMDSNGNPRTQEFIESWQLGAERTLSQAHTYDLKADPDLLWVRISSTRKTRCVCEPPKELASEPES